MANQTVSVNRNFDDAAISGLLNGEVTTINTKAILTIDSDPKWSQQAVVLGNVSLSDGELLIDGRNVWEIHFTSSTGNVPTLAALGSNGVTAAPSAATGELLRVWGNASKVPLAAGGAMPASGWIKLRSKTGDFLPGDVITLPGGATITATDAGRRSWIHVVGRETSTVTPTRLGTLKTRGDWYELGVLTTGSAQVIEYPVVDVPPAIQIETGPGTNIYKWWLSAGTKWNTNTALYGQEEARGRIFGCPNPGQIELRSSTFAEGYLPPAGCKIRVPNIILSSAAQANYDVFTRNTTVATRYDVTTTSNGNIDLENCSGSWYMSCTTPYRFQVRHSALFAFFVNTAAESVEIHNCGFGASELVNFGFSIANTYAGINVTDSSFFRQFSAGPTFVLTDCSDVFVSNCEFHLGSTSVSAPSHAVNATSVTLTRCIDTAFEDCKLIGGRFLMTTCFRIEIKWTSYIDMSVLSTLSTNPVSCFVIEASSDDIVIQGLTFPVTNNHPYTSLVAITNSSKIVIKDIGTPDNPLSMGTLQLPGVLGSASVSKGLKFQRIYTTGGFRSTNFFTLNTTVQDVVFEDVWFGESAGSGFGAISLTAFDVQMVGCQMGVPLTSAANAYGVHWITGFHTNTKGFIRIMSTEPIADTLDQCVVSGNVRFNAAGQAFIYEVGASITWTSPFFIRGVAGGFENASFLMSGLNLADLTTEYQIDLGDGNGFSPWQPIANIYTITSTDPNVGFRLKLRITKTGSSAAISGPTYITLITLTDTTSRKVQQPTGYFTIQGANPTDYVELWDESTDSLVDVRRGEGPVYYTNVGGITPFQGFVVRKDSTGTVIMSTRYQAIYGDPVFGGVISVYAGNEIQVAVGGVTALDVRAALPEVGLIPGLF